MNRISSGPINMKARRDRLEAEALDITSPAMRMVIAIV
jgi:hypothetical protein